MFASIAVVGAELKGFLPWQTTENTERVVHLLCLQVKLRQLSWRKYSYAVDRLY